jgi:hypothetical protein
MQRPCVAARVALLRMRGVLTSSRITYGRCTPYYGFIRQGRSTIAQFALTAQLILIVVTMDASCGLIHRKSSCGLGKACSDCGTGGVRSNYCRQVPDLYAL